MSGPASGGVARGDAREVLDPHFPAGRMKIAIFEREAVQPPVLELLAQVQHARAVFGVQMLRPEFQGSEPLFPVRGDAAEFA